jgi:quinoprotein relay system zinc metallohydrolase 2
MHGAAVRPFRSFIRGLSALVIAVAAFAGEAASPDLSALALDNPAPGVYVHYGALADVARENLGDVANVGFIVGTRCVAVIDTGGSYAIGRALRAAIRSVTTVPVCFVVNTHMHPDHVFGNAAFADDHPQFIGHQRLADALRRRGQNYVAALHRELGELADGSEIVLPTRTVTGNDTIDLGGRTIELRAWRTAHTDNDLTVLDKSTGTMFFGDLAFVGHLPVVDGSLRGFIAVTDELSSLHVARPIPGHGRAGPWPEALEPQARYLRGLAADVRAAIKAKRTLSEAVAGVGVTGGDWKLVDAFHKRNVTAAYAELEWEE